MAYSQLIQTYMGVGTLATRPASPNVAAGVAALYYATDTASLYAWDGSAWHTITSGGGSDAQLLTYALTSDITAMALTNGSWTDVIANQTFTPTAPSATIEIYCGGMCTLAGSGGQGSSRLVIDSAGTPTYLYLGGCQPGQNLLSGSVPHVLTTLSAAAHTVKLQAYATSIGSPLLYCRAATQPNNEFLGITVMERA